MKNIANYISISRIIMSIILTITETLSIIFYIIYFYCGISDMLDGYIARTSGLKALSDYFAYMCLVHRQKECMFNKVGLIITSAGGFGVK